MYKHLMSQKSNPEEAFLRLKEIVEVLRKECPWDREQTHKSLRGCLIEEAYETADAIDTGNVANLREELGDVLLQVVFHGTLGEENGHFSISDIINEECEKMIRRHPHVFSEEGVKSVDKVLEKWENIKVSESGDMSHRDRLKQVPMALPALIRSYKVQKKAARAGFDWEDSSGAFDKLSEEIQELTEAYARGDKGNIAEELGDVLFSVVNVARFIEIEPESALNATTDKFIRRFSYVEETSERQGKTLEEMTLEEMDELWDEAKRYQEVR